MIAELKAVKSANMELRLELEKRSKQLAMERRLSKSYLDDIEKTRRETAEELSKAVSMVRQRVEQGQERRQTDLITLATTGSILGDDMSFITGIDDLDMSFSIDGTNTTNNSSRQNYNRSSHRRGLSATPSVTRHHNTVLYATGTTGGAAGAGVASTISTTSSAASSPSTHYRLRKIQSEADVLRSGYNNNSSSSKAMWRPTMPATAESTSDTMSPPPTDRSNRSSFAKESERVVRRDDGRFTIGSIGDSTENFREGIYDEKSAGASGPIRRSISSDGKPLGRSVLINEAANDIFLAPASDVSEKSTNSTTSASTTSATSASLLAKGIASTIFEQAERGYSD
jgi:hypothetical protein